MGVGDPHVGVNPVKVEVVPQYPQVNFVFAPPPHRAGTAEANF